MQQISPQISQRTSQGALQVLEVFASAAEVTFDRMLASRVLGEASGSVSGDDSQAWSRRLVDVGESLNLRIRYVECTLDEALSFVRQGIPIAFCDAGPLGELRWNVLDAAKGRKVRWTALQPDRQSRWVSPRKLRKSMNLDPRDPRARWVMGQAALACQPPRRPDSHRSQGQPLSPLARLFGLFRPEKKDISIVAVFSLVVGVLALATPVAVEALVNTVAFGRYLQPVIILSLLLFTFLAFAAAIRALITYVVELFQRRLFIRVVEDLAYRLPRVRREEFDQHHGPELVNRFLDVAIAQKTASTLLLDGISIVLQTVVGMAVLAFYHPFLLGFDVVLLASIAFVIFVLGRGSVYTAIKESKMKYAVAAWLEELARHCTAFKLNSGDQFALERADQLAVDWLQARRDHFRIVMRQILFALGLQAVAATALLGLGGWLVILGELTLGQLVAAELIVMMIVGSFAKLGKHMESFYDLLAAVDKLGVLFDLNIESHDKLSLLGASGPAAVHARDVSYRYQGESVLNHFSFDLAPGESVALVGRSGAGKSTLVDILCGLRSASSGHVELDGTDLREIRPDSLREHMSVARGVEIFHGTIDENIHLNRSNLRSKDVRDALESVGLLDAVQKLTDGLTTVLRTDGAPLTPSQAHRLMLARAIVGRPRLLMIDGTLDGLPDTEIDQMLDRLKARNVPWTLLVVSCRRSVIEACDRVVRLVSEEVEPVKPRLARHAEEQRVS